MGEGLALAPQAKGSIMGARRVRLGQRTYCVPGSQNQFSCAGVSSVSVTFLIPVRRIDVMEEEAILIQFEEYRSSRVGKAQL